MWSPWRVVEHQAHISTRRLTDSDHEQHRLEELLDAAKPPKAAVREDLHWLLHSPFRYYPADGLARFSSRYSRSHFYGAELVTTALAEIGFKLLVAFADMADNGGGHVLNDRKTAFQAQASGPSVDLTQPPFTAHKEQLAHPDDYGACQTLADEMQAEGVQMARYTSVRDPALGACIVIFSPAAFVQPQPIAQQSWALYGTAEIMEWQRLLPADNHAYKLRREDVLIDGRLPRPSVRAPV